MAQPLLEFLARAKCICLSTRPRAHLAGMFLERAMPRFVLGDTRLPHVLSKGFPVCGSLYQGALEMSRYGFIKGNVLALAIVAIVGLAAGTAKADIVVVTGVNNQGTDNVLLNP